MYTVIRGQKDKVDNFINDLQAINMVYGDPTPGGLRHTVQLGVHPIQLYELVFPKEHFEMILNTIAPNFNNTEGRQAQMLLLQKARFLVKGTKIPLVNLIGKPRYIVRNQAVSTYPFAIKEDQVWQGVPVLEPAPGEVTDDGTKIPKELIGHERL